MKSNILIFKNWQGDLLAIIAGSLIPFAFAPFDFSILALVSICLLMLSWANISRRRAFFRGWLFGLFMFGIGVNWIHISMMEFGGVNAFLSYFLTSLFVMFLALFPAVTGYMARRFSDRGTHQIAREYLLIIPAMWTMFEWIKGFIFTGFPWLSLGYSQLYLPVSGFAPLVGVYGVSFVLVLSSGFIVYWLLMGKQVTKIALPSLLILWIVPYSLNQLNWSDPVEKPITVSLIQGNISQDKKWLREELRPTLQMYTKLSRENWNSDLIIWPETAIPSFHHQVETFLQDIAQEARMNGSELLVGLPVYNNKEKLYFNSMMSLGLKEGFYHKEHLVPFGEFIPFKDWIGDILQFFNIPMSNFSSGTQESPVLLVGGHKAGISICYEDVFGEEVIAALPEAKFLINASNDAWFGDSVAAPQHLQIAQMRSLETSRHLVRSTNTGVSAFIDEKGRIISKSPEFERHVLTSQVIPMEGMTPYAVFGNITIISTISILLGIAFFLGKEKSESTN